MKIIICNSNDINNIINNDINNIIINSNINVMCVCEIILLLY